MLLALRSLFEPAAPPVVIPPGFGGGGQTYPFRPVFPPRSVAAEVTLRPARAKFRAGKLTATGGANIKLFSVKGSLLAGKMEASGAATVQTESARGTFRANKITASGIDNDPVIAISLLDL